MPDDPTVQLSESLGFLPRIRYGGPVGKLAALSIATIIVIGFIAASCWRNEIVHLAALGVVALVVLATLWYIRKIVNEHPELATLEGKEVVDLAQMQLAAKNVPALPNPLPTTDPQPPMIEAPREDEE